MIYSHLCVYTLSAKKSINSQKHQNRKCGIIDNEGVIHQKPSNEQSKCYSYHTVFNDGQNPYSLESYKTPQNVLMKNEHRKNLKRSNNEYKQSLP